MPRIVFMLVVALSLAFGASSALSQNGDDHFAAFVDPTGDASDGADITKVSVSHNPKGVITFKISIPAWQTIAPGRAVAIQFDSDDRPSKGWMDHWVAIYNNRTLPEDEDFSTYYSDRPFGIGHPPEWISYTWQGSVVTIKVDGRLLLVSEPEDLQGPDGGYPALKFSIPERFKFKVLSFLAEEVGHPDTFLRLTLADQTDIWSYEVEILRDLVLKAFQAPKSVKAGKDFTVKLTAVRDDTGEQVFARPICKAKIGKTLLRQWNPPLVAGVTRPSATCSWIVPKTIKGKTTKGKVIKGEISLTVPEGPRGVTETKQFSVKVK